MSVPTAVDLAVSEIPGCRVDFNEFRFENPQQAAAALEFALRLRGATGSLEFAGGYVTEANGTFASLRELRARRGGLEDVYAAVQLTRTRWPGWRFAETPGGDILDDIDLYYATARDRRAGGVA